MLQQMRELFRYLKWILLVIVVMFLWWVFVPGGSAPPTGTDAGWAARVNGEPISVGVFQAYARQLDATYRSLLGEQYEQQRAVIRVGQQAINSLIEEELVYQEAVEQGIRVTEREVADAITRDPSLQENGRFIGLERYRRLFRGGSVGLAAFEAGVRRDLMIDKFRSLVEDGVEVHDDEVEREFLQRNERLTVDYLVLDRTAVAGGAEPDDVEVAAYYDAHPDRYSRGDGRTGLYVLFSARTLAESREVSDAEVRDAYDRARDSRFTRPEQRRASHILFRLDPGASPAEVERVEKKARAVLRRARSGEEFAVLAREFSEDSTAAAGGDLDFFGRGRMVKEFEDAAFSLEVGGIGDLVRTAFGFHIIKVTDARDARTVPFEEARAQILQELKMNRARSEVLKQSAAFAKAAAGGKLESAAKARGLTVNETGIVRSGDALPGVAASQSVTARMLALGEGEVSEPIPVPAGQVVVQVTGSAPPEPRPLTEIRARVVEDMLSERALERVTAALEAVRSRSGSIRDLGKRLEAEIRTGEDLARGVLPAGLPADPGLRRQLRDLPPGALGEPVATPSGLVVLSVRERRVDRDELDVERDSIRDSLARQRRDRLYRALLRRLRMESRIELNEPLVTSLDQG